MKKSSKKEATMSIQEVAELFKNFAVKAKEAEEAAKPYKELLLAYAKEHPEAFDESTLKFDNGVRVEIRESEKPTWDKGAMLYEWVGEAIDAGLDKAVMVVINAKGIPAKLNVLQKQLLRDIKYKVEYSSTFAVYAGEKK